MARKLTASDRKALIRLASTLPKGSPERRTILARLALESETFDLMDQLSPDFGATEGGAWVDDVTYGKPRWDKSQGKMVRPYKAQVSGEIIGSVDGGPEAYKEALLGMASWKAGTLDYAPSLETKVNLPNGVELHGIIAIDEEFLLIAVIPRKGAFLISDSAVHVPIAQVFDEFHKVLSRPPSGLFSDDLLGDYPKLAWGVPFSDPAQDLKKAKAALKKLLDAASKIFG